MKFFSIVCIIAVLVSCKATVEGEQSKYERNKNELSGLAITYPKFADPINAHISIIEKKWQEALAISGDEEKIKALSNINKTFKPTAVRTLMELEKSISTLEADIKFLEEQKASNVTLGLIREIDEARQKIQETENALKNTEEEVTDLNQMQTIVGGHLTNMNKVKGVISAQANKIREEQKAEQESQQASQQGEASQAGDDHSSDKTSTAPAAPAKEKMVKCSYCGTKNKESRVKCSNCGASL